MNDKNNTIQSNRFIEAAREHDCDESEEAFNEKLKKLSEAEPKKSEKD